MNETVEVVFNLLGGLAVFIFGMNMMSESLQKVAGERMKSILAMFTKNPVVGVLAGALVTAVLQSSSATTVMAIGFVSAGLMGLPQAIPIILGANIGTTITAQIIAFKITDYIPAIIFVGFLMTFVAKGERIRGIGRSIFGFGLLFLGIETMGSAMKPLASSPVFIDMITQVSGIPVLGVLVGALMTLVVQSSSATIAVLQNLASQPGPDGVTSVIGLTGAIPVLLGDNIGTTITALLASIGQSRNAKRVALSHCFFNISGCLLFIWFVAPYASLIQAISPMGPEIEVISRQIANAHTGFNITMTLIWLPFVWLMVKLVMAVLPEKKIDSDADLSFDQLAQPRFLDEHLIPQPSAALQLVVRELLRISSITQDVLDQASKAQKKSEFAAVAAKAEVIGKLCARTNEYLSELFSGGILTEEQAGNTANLMCVLNDFERIGYLCGDAVTSVSMNYSKAARTAIRAAFALASNMLEEATAAIETGQRSSDDFMVEKKLEMLEMGMDMRKDHMRRVADRQCSAELTSSFNRVLDDIDRVGSACTNIVDTGVRNGGFVRYLALDEVVAQAQQSAAQPA